MPPTATILTFDRNRPRAARKQPAVVIGPSRNLARLATARPEAAPLQAGCVAYPGGVPQELLPLIEQLDIIRDTDPAVLNQIRAMSQRAVARRARSAERGEATPYPHRTAARAARKTVQDRAGGPIRRARARAMLRTP